MAPSSDETVETSTCAPYTSNRRACRNLETIEVVCCGELREIFSSDPGVQQQEHREFPRLKRIYLYELPMLQHIYGHHMLAPNLERLKIRGCWSLKRLPAVRRPSRHRRRESMHRSERTIYSYEFNEEEAQTLPQ
ncbi:unnamed protein product [Miscanthus lutarioriparius]|uniref:Disease resistance protein At4g27190-like leucine-rich repeats domain-containing protein n=1 Tax=Miscanthus lutarioriparius TaxID=422564 RepID=A0A811SD00_9POAL|nr:unnamed protein product [Miscanthus lutarioriparius]